VSVSSAAADVTNVRSAVRATLRSTNVAGFGLEVATTALHIHTTHGGSIADDCPLGVGLPEIAPADVAHEDVAVLGRVDAEEAGAERRVARYR
jgi:hypothetical protein